MSIDWFTFVAQVINFVVLLALLNHFLYGPITKAIAKREQSIAEKLTRAEKRETDAQTELEKYRTLSSEMEAKRSAMLKQANAESNKVRSKLLTEARNEVQFRRDDWLQSLHRDQRLLVNSLRQKAGEQIVEVSRNALSQLADTEIEGRSLEQFVKRLPEVSDLEKRQLKQETMENENVHVHTPFPLDSEWQTKIEKALRDELGLESVSFVTTPSLVLGIELHVGGRKIGWSVQDYLESLGDELGSMLENS